MSFDIKRALSPNKALYAAGLRLKDWADGVQAPPFALELQPTDACTLACSYCSYSVRRGKGRAWPRSLFERVCDDVIAMKVPVVYLSGGGEPTLSSYLPTAAERLHAAGCALGLNTNGQDGDVVEAVAGCLGYVLVHVADPDPTRYRNLMGEDNAGVLDLPHRLRRAGHKDLVIGARVVVVDQTLSHLTWIAEQLSDLGFTYVNFTLARDFEDRGIGLDVAASMDALGKLIEHPLFKAGFAEIGWPTTTAYTPAKACWSTEMGLGAAIGPSGDVYLCVPDIGFPEFSVGNIREAPFSEIWNSARRLEMVERLSHRYASGGCANCRFIACNTLIEPLVDAARSPHREFC